MLFGSTGPVYLGMIAGRQKVSRFCCSPDISSGATG